MQLKLLQEEANLNEVSLKKDIMKLSEDCAQKGKVIEALEVCQCYTLCRGVSLRGGGGVRAARASVLKKFGPSPASLFTICSFLSFCFSRPLRTVNV